MTLVPGAMWSRTAAGEEDGPVVMEPMMPTSGALVVPTVPGEWTGRTAVGRDAARRSAGAGPLAQLRTAAAEVRTVTGRLVWRRSRPGRSTLNHCEDAGGNVDSRTSATSWSASARQVAV